jgi:Domain of unknown function (DUF4304)
MFGPEMEIVPFDPLTYDMAFKNSFRPALESLAYKWKKNIFVRERKDFYDIVWFQKGRTYYQGKFCVNIECCPKRHMLFEFQKTPLKGDGWFTMRFVFPDSKDDWCWSDNLTPTSVGAIVQSLIEFDAKLQDLFKSVVPAPEGNWWFSAPRNYYTSGPPF